MEIQFVNKQEYDSARTGLLRKLRDCIALLDKLGTPNPYEGKFIRCHWNKDTGVGIFLLEDAENKKNTPNRLYSVSNL